jgi:Winged helix DNA-binding domain
MSQGPMAGYRASECFVGAARKASRRLTQFYDDALEPCGLRSTQYTILAELARLASPPTLAALASALVSDRSAVGHNLRPLIRDGYIALKPGAEDRRERRIHLTARGQSKHGRRGRFGRPPRTNFSRSMARTTAKVCGRRCSILPMTRGSAGLSKGPRHDAGRSGIGAGGATAACEMGERAARPRPALRLGRVVHDHARFEHRRGLAPVHRPQSQCFSLV